MRAHNILYYNCSHTIAPPLVVQWYVDNFSFVHFFNSINTTPEIEVQTSISGVVFAPTLRAFGAQGGGYAI
ncbi:MAG TPA: hypothetical protein ENI56_01120 [Candidatus Kaiserbacteria bacterium]|nr:hypothetical protein [Candidatus Kaiserbacteria bacterium]